MNDIKSYIRKNTSTFSVEEVACILYEQVKPSHRLPGSPQLRLEISEETGVITLVQTQEQIESVVQR